MADSLEIRAPRDDEFRGVLKLRYDVLDSPKGLPEKIVPSTHDMMPTTIHMAAFLEKKVVCTVRFDMLDQETFLVRRMATDPAYRRQGIGAKVIRSAEKHAVEQGAMRIVLHSREDAVGFYQKLGYELTGKVEVHDGDSNPEMIKIIS